MICRWSGLFDKLTADRGGGILHLRSGVARAPPLNGIALCGSESVLRTTAYFQAIRSRPDRVIIEQAWIERVMASPEKESVQADGRIRLWGRVPEFEDRYLRVILLPDRQTVHNAFFDRGFKP